ncbi:MAG TPA: hypothetical protein VMQ52_03195 [Candidatus Saccharimonadales bacterium]|jgi:hypothetical protein|nr:hypothetical protein [Candidatus Saccharimonadales bacterium]
MKNKAFRYIFLSQCVLVVGLAICYLIYPHNVNISYLGNLRETIIPYALGFIGSSYLLWKACVQFDSQKNLQRALRFLVIFLLAILCTPFTVDIGFHIAHDLVASTYFMTAFVISCLILKIYKVSVLNVILLLIEFFSLITLIIVSRNPHLYHYQLFYELLNLISSGILLDYNVLSKGLSKS